ncbi:MAG: hypothetical protein ACLFNT_02590 [Spirochaetales bacterium]
MKQSVNYVQRYSLTDLFDRTFRMIGSSWKVSLLGGLVVIGPAAILLAVVVPLQIKNVIAISLQASTSAGADLREVFGILLWTGLSMLSGIVYSVAALWARLAVVHSVRDAATATAPQWHNALRQALHVSLLRVVGQAVLKALIGAACIAIPTILFALVASGDGWVPPLLIAVIYLGATAVFTWIFFSFFFSAEAVVFDGERTVAGMGRSWRLVGGNWWRLFGITILVTIMISFVAGLITTPIVGASLVPISANIFDLVLSDTASEQAVLQAFSNTTPLSIAIALATIVQQLISLIFVPVFYALFYIDLKVRHGELESRATDSPGAGEAPSEESPRGE